MAQILESLVGHRDAILPLLEAQASGRLASTLLFAGPSGIGKKLAAQALAQALVCEKPASTGEACGTCGPCLRAEKGQTESVMLVEPDGAQIKIEQARDILQFLSLQKMGRSRVVIIDQAHVMNPQAGNALLKSLEEPPAGSYFILVSPLAAAVLPTIRSRSQLVRFRPLGDKELAKILGPDADEWVIRSAQGSVETAQRLLESREDYQELEETACAYLDAARTRFPSDEISRLRELIKDRTAQAFLAHLIQGVLRDALRLQSGVQAIEGHGGRGSLAQTAAANFGGNDLSNLAETSLALENDFSRNVDRGLVLENFALSWRNAVRLS